MTTLAQDLRYALRVLRNAPGFTLVAALTLSLGVGANAAMVGLFDALLVRPPEGVAEPERLVRVRTEMVRVPGRPPLLVDALSYPQVRALQAGAGLSAIAAYAGAPLSVGEGEGARNEQVILASGGYFSTLGVRPALGRLIGPGDDLEGAANPVAVLSWAYWQRAYGGDPSVLGTQVRVAGRPLTVVGVAPRHFTGADLASPALWVPLWMAGSLGYDPEMMTSPFVSWLSVVGRLAPGATAERARSAAQAALLAAQEQGIASAPPRMGGGGMPGGRVSMRITRGEDGRPGEPAAAPPPPRVHLARLAGAAGAGGGAPGGGAPVQLWYLAVTAAVLLIACANVANLLLARGAARQHELAVRLSLGATSRRLGRQLITESGLLAVLGGAGGFLVALGVWRLLPSLVQLPPLPPLLDARLLAITAALTGATVLLFGIAPLLGLRRPSIRTLLGAAAPPVARRSRGRSALVVVQFAVSVMLLIGAGLFIRSFQEVQGLDLGYAREEVLVLSADTRGAGWTPQRAEQFWAAVQERVGRLPEVRGTALAASVPYLMRMRVAFAAAGAETAGEAPEPAQLDHVGPAFFSTLGIPVLEGRPITEADRRATARVAVVSESYARETFGGESALGRCLTGGMEGACTEVVGVVGDARFGELTDESPAMIYTPLEQRPEMAPGAGVLHVRAQGDPAALAAALRREVRAADPAAPPVEVRTIDELLAPQLAPWRGSAVLLGVFGGIGLLLAAVGLYGVVAYLVTSRTREIGIRLALGADRPRILAMVLGDAARMVAVGAGLGVVGALAGSRFAASLLYGVGPLDPAVYALTAALLTAVAVGAALVPARRATRVEPVEALRAE